MSNAVTACNHVNPDSNGNVTVQHTVGRGGGVRYAVRKEKGSGKGESERESGKGRESCFSNVKDLQLIL